MIQKIQTALWFARRPTYWWHAANVALRRLRADHDGPHQARAAAEWAAARAVPVADALAAVGLDVEPDAFPLLPVDLLAEGHRRAEHSAVRMGGPGDVNLLYAAVKLSGAWRVVETGVAYGWSSLAILAALDGRDGARLVSVDMPYPKINNEAFVGIAVPERLRGRWRLIHAPDRHGLERAIAEAGGTIDLCHYDSDKSWWGRQYGFPLLWEALRPGGVFISDDVQDNMAFAEFVADRNLGFAISEFEGKYVGVTRKP